MMQYVSFITRYHAEPGNAEPEALPQFFLLPNEADPVDIAWEHLIFVKILLLAPSFFLFPSSFFLLPPASCLLPQNSNF
ncbi:hypothetical protein QUB05_12020 [Microcoleus sp. F10-C6]|uniref:hypothetical protein n=1 Tax=unclassified Microcoleus TaxID=2642155 RepID=UPI002FD1D351